MLGKTNPVLPHTRLPDVSPPKQVEEAPQLSLGVYEMHCPSNPDVEAALTHVEEILMLARSCPSSAIHTTSLYAKLQSKADE